MMERANILLVDDQPGKLASYEVILAGLGENLLKASSAREALEVLLKNDVAVILVDVCMPELDGFELARMIREHPRYSETAIIFISAIMLSEPESLRAYDLGAVDYVSVPVVPGILRAKVRVFVDLYRKTRALARVNDELEERVRERTAELETAITRQELLAREVDHRARNALAVIQSIVTMMPSEGEEGLARIIEGRIRAMARAHTLLSQTRWEGADLARLVNEELDPYKTGDNISIRGPAISVRADIAQNFALAIHEMATNAAKYGALSVAGGKLQVSWRLDGDELRLNWIESGSTPVSPPTKLGFGSKVIDASINRQLKGVVENDWAAHGLHSVLRIPAEHFSSPALVLAARQSQRRTEAVTHLTRSFSGQRVLLVEDEPIVALMMKTALSEMGADVMGPYDSLADAMSVEIRGLAAAVLDINLRGELVYPLAERLAGEGTPILFVTGYDASSIAPGFSSAKVLAKPVDTDELTAWLGTVIGGRTQAGAQMENQKV
jgi:two-component sensor histidine kinase/two-component SAPR family response regulator